MNLWENFERKRKTETQGLSLHFQEGIDPTLRAKYISFVKWLRLKYVFPIHLNVYIINAEKIQLKNGRWAYGGFRWYEKRTPMIRIASAIELDLLNEYTLEEIYEQILSSFVHELTHYYQWILDLEQSNATSERQANYFRYRIIEQYHAEGR